MKNISIIIKIAIGFVSIFVTFISVNVITVLNINKSQEDTQWVNHTHQVLKSIDKVLADLQNAETGQRGFLITGLDHYLEPYHSATENENNDLENLKNLTVDNPIQQERIAELKTLILSKFTEMEETISLRKSSGFEVARQVVISDLGKEIMDNIRLILTEMEDEEYRLLKERNEVGEARVVLSKKIMFWLTLIAGLLTIVLIFFYIKIISKPIKRLASYAGEIAQGNLSVLIDEIDGNDEVGLLTKSFRTMQINLLKKAKQAEEIANGNLSIDVTPISDKDNLGKSFELMVSNLRSQLNEIKAATNTLSSFSSKIMVMTSQLATASIETVSSVTEVSSTIEEIKQTAEISNSKAIEVAKSAQKLAKISLEGNQSVKKTIEGMNKIKEQMESIANIVIQLSEKSYSIGEIATTVNDLADQSNLLAVNASIEAAKAGEHGKGFAVVAQEIKNLASRSKESTIQIRAVLADIQKEISGTVLATEEGAKVIDKGLKLSSSANKVIFTLSGSMEQASQANLQIAASSQQQLIGLEQIREAMDYIKVSSNQNSTNSMETENSIEELQKLGDSLLNLLGQYKLN